MKYWTPRVNEMAQPELRRAASTDDGAALENPDADTGGLEGLGATEPGKAGADNRNEFGILHRANVNISIQGATS